MSKYADDYICTCEMNLVTCINDYHAQSCDLWLEPTFVDGSDEWDGDLGTLVLNRSPWHNADDYIWNGDTPVCRKATAEARTVAQSPIVISDGAEPCLADAITEWAQINKHDDDEVFITEGEQEVLDALTSGAASVDASGLIDLNNGSYADFEARTTYRKIIGDDGAPTWVEELWDDGACYLSEFSGDTADIAPVECQCLPPKRFYCHVCKVQREKESDLWGPWDPKSGVKTSTVVGSYIGGGATSTYYGNWKSCHHNMDPFMLPGKQHRNIVISAKRTHTADTTPDYGLYLYNGWDPRCVATLLPWQDYGLPTVTFEKAASAIKYAYDLACSGQKVEVGCMGGHGRTGTVLACMAILSKPDMTPQEAVAWVRKVHCHEAIETNQQEWFVAWFQAWHLGGTCPPMPTTYVSKHDANWNAASTAAKAVKGGATVMGPKAPISTLPPAAGTWCDECKRTVVKYHNGGCSQDVAHSSMLKPEHFENTVTAIPQGAMSGSTANARRRNAKRANRRNAKKFLAQTRNGG